MTKEHGKNIKNDKQYEALRRKGMSKEKSARIVNAPDASQNGGKSSKLEDRTKHELLEQAKKIGIVGRHRMNKQMLIDAIRNH